MYAIALLILSAGGSDYTVTRSVRIDSERPIALLILEMGMGVLNGRDGTASLGSLVEAGEAEIETQLSVDGKAQPGPSSVRAAFRLLGFLLWDAAGSVERITDLEYRGRRVRVVDGASDGRVWTRVTIGPPLGDQRVRAARLVLTAEENEDDRERLRMRGTEHGNTGLAAAGRWLRGTTIRLSCSADLDLPGDRCGIIRRFAERAARERAGPELNSRINGLADTGRQAVLAGRSEIDAVVAKFIREVCR
jgi:hypothetical protein